MYDTSIIFVTEMTQMIYYLMILVSTVFGFCGCIVGFLWPRKQYNKSVSNNLHALLLFICSFSFVTTCLFVGCHIKS